tara:strand:- start:258 stop:470 length:213 start_codon:yes stop_codon:yes gene_type:complete
MFGVIISQYSDKLVSEFTSLKESTLIQTEIFNKVILYGLAKCQEIVIYSTTITPSGFKTFSPTDKKVLIG